MLDYNTVLIQGELALGTLLLGALYRTLPIQVYVLRPTKMEFLPFHADIEIGQVLEAPLMMYYIDRETRETVAFTDCSLLELDVSTDKQGIFTPAEEGKVAKLQV